MPKPSRWEKLPGVALGPSNEGIPGITITIVKEGATLQETVTGYGGEFSFSQLDPGHYLISAALEGIMSSEKVPVEVQPGKTVRTTLAMAFVKLHETVTVRGRHETLSIPEIRESLAVDLGEAMMRMPGLAKVRKGAIANDIVLRGLQRDNINVLIDGCKIYGACPNRMDSPAFHVDFSEIEHIEVTKGPFDIENQGSLGGMVNIVTLRPESGFHLGATLAGGSAEYLNPSLNLSYRREDRHRGGRVLLAQLRSLPRRSRETVHRNRQLYSRQARFTRLRRRNRLGQILPDPPGRGEDRARLYAAASRSGLLSRAADGFAPGTMPTAWASPGRGRT